jgi:hypothetical protein
MVLRWTLILCNLVSVFFFQTGYAFPLSPVKSPHCSSRSALGTLQQRGFNTLLKMGRKAQEGTLKQGRSQSGAKSGCWQRKFLAGAALLSVSFSSPQLAGAKEEKMRGCEEGKFQQLLVKTKEAWNHGHFNRETKIVVSAGVACAGVALVAQSRNRQEEGHGAPTVSRPAGEPAARAKAAFDILTETKIREERVAFSKVGMRPSGAVLCNVDAASQQSVAAKPAAPDIQSPQQVPLAKLNALAANTKQWNIGKDADASAGISDEPAMESSSYQAASESAAEVYLKMLDEVYNLRSSLPLLPPP